MNTNYREIARQKAQKYGLLPQVFERQIEAESGFNPKAISSAGARGIAQIMPETAKGWGVNPDDPTAALDAAAKNMAGYIKTYLGGKQPSQVNDPKQLREAYEKGLRAYNAGPAAVEASKKYDETNRYVQKIIGPDNFSFTEALQGRQPEPAQVATAPKGNTYIIYGEDPGLDFLRGYTGKFKTPEIQGLTNLASLFNAAPKEIDTGFDPVKILAKQLVQPSGDFN
jgi:hypothetical protein